MLKISLLTLLTQNLKYLAGITDFIPGEGGGGQGGGGGLRRHNEPQITVKMVMII